MKVLIIGSNGQLGRQMQKTLAENEIPYNAFDLPEIDITDSNSIKYIIEDDDYHTIVNCAAYTNVDGAETNGDLAFKINAIGPKNLAVLSKKYSLELIHVSTDYVFSGDGIEQEGRLRPYVETDECYPNTIYGKTKLEGEKLIEQNSFKHYILRTAWLYGDGNNFVKTMLRLANSCNKINVVNDQFGSPTSTVDLAAAIISLMGSGEYGLYHATCEGICTWYEFANKIFELQGVNVNLNPVSSKEFVRPAPRPAWSVLENRHLNELGRNNFRHWQVSLEEYLEDLSKKEEL